MSETLSRHGAALDLERRANRVRPKAGRRNNRVRRRRAGRRPRTKRRAPVESDAAMSCHRPASPACSQCSSSIVHVGAPSRPAMHCTCAHPVSGPSWSATTKFRFANKPSIHCHPLVVPRHCPQRTSSIMHAFPLHRAVRYPVAKMPAASITPNPSFFPINELALLQRLDSSSFSECRYGIVRGVPDTDHAARPIHAHTATVPAPLAHSRIYRAEGGDLRPPGASNTS